MRLYSRSTLAGFSFVLALSSPVLAAPGPDSALIGTDAVALGVTSAGALVQFSPNGANALLPGCACDAQVELGVTPLSGSVEAFTYTSATASSSVIDHDAASGENLRVVHDFYPSPEGGSTYEALVTITNLGDTEVQPTYSRTLEWASGPVDPASLASVDPSVGSVQPTADGLGIQLQVGLPPIAPGGTQQFRLFFGDGANLPADAAVISQSQTVVFGYAPGATSPVAGGGGGGGGSRGGSGGGGGGGATHANTNTNSATNTNPSANTNSVTITNTTSNTKSGTTTSTGTTGDTGASDHTATGDTNTDQQVIADQSSGANAPAQPIGLLTLFTSPANNQDAPATDPQLPFLPATPELDSLVLVGAGLLSFGSYAAMRLRSGRRGRTPKRARDSST